MFLFDLNAQPVGTVITHFNTCKKTHQQQRQYEKYDRVDMNHGAKIEQEGELKDSSGGYYINEVRPAIIYREIPLQQLLLQHKPFQVYHS